MFQGMLLDIGTEEHPGQILKGSPRVFWRFHRTQCTGILADAVPRQEYAHALRPRKQPVGTPYHTVLDGGLTQVLKSLPPDRTQHGDRTEKLGLANPPRRVGNFR